MPRRYRNMKLLSLLLLLHRAPILNFDFLFFLSSILFCRFAERQSQNSQKFAIEQIKKKQQIVVLEMRPMPNVFNAKMKT